MRPAPDPGLLLESVLNLERRQGFQDRAAMGGLSAFAQMQVERNRPHGSDALAAASAALRNYGTRDRSAREAAVEAALQHLRRQDTIAAKLDSPATESIPSPRLNDANTPSTARFSEPAPLGTTSRPSRARSSKPREPVALDSDIASLKGMRKSMSDALARLGVHSVRDVLYNFPRTHYDYTDTRSISRLRVGAKTTLVGRIRDVRNNYTNRKVVITTATIEDDTGVVAVRWFNQPYLTQQLTIGARIAITGEPDVNNGRVSFVPRDYELINDLGLTHAARLVPVYPLTKGLYQRSLRQFVHDIVTQYSELLDDFMPREIRTRHGLPELGESVLDYHFPVSPERKERAQRRLAFDELLLIQLGLLMRKAEWRRPEVGSALPQVPDWLRRFEQTLPYVLTSAQRRVIAEIASDLSSPLPMSRLLQGDVGSGKTVVAAAALLQTAKAGRQGVLMAPTEILAEQHFRTLTALLEPFDVHCALLVGSMTKAQKKTIRDLVACGAAHVVVGTHALIQNEVELPELGLAVTDEQHRFGVEQRNTLRQKGWHPHTLAMTATPIPRTLAMTIYGDLDVSSLDEMPPGRLSVTTTWSRSPAEAYALVRNEVRKGRQAFVICPVIEESADSDLRSVMAEHKELQSLTFADLSVGLLHGRMRASQKDETLAAFRRGELDILVATSVVEVGIDVPNATVMVIRDAHRFGLAQLHQFRGRVGRGGDQAYCVLLSATEGNEAAERLAALTATENGFELAEEDLRLRGPGEFWGTRQSGLPALKVAQLGDVRTIELARAAAQEMLADDPTLAAPAHGGIRQQVEIFWSASADLS